MKFDIDKYMEEVIREGNRLARENPPSPEVRKQIDEAQRRLDKRYQEDLKRKQQKN